MARRSSIRWRGLIAAICLAAILAFRVDPTLLALPFIDRTELHTYFSRVADGVWYPEYPRFLQDVYAHTQRGDSIAIVVPPMQWDKGYSYAYYRASYLLPGRIVLPLVLPND
ncbi:MAG TPA: hypothetical protein VEZ11_11470, partial [Thermoanaerobaculia bacterium]|nr:hypothetical protein [Thermoanaerobaculia bacterium]